MQYVVEHVTFYQNYVASKCNNAAMVTKAVNVNLQYYSYIRTVITRNYSLCKII
jgi:hypothetical protein